jgi:DNA-binding NarL/FixJ family response regulator
MPPSTEAVRLFLLDDHPAIRDAVSEAVAEETSITVAGGASTAEDLIDELEATEPDLLILDLSLPDAHGLDVLQQVSARFPDLDVLVFSMYDERIYAERALSAGARGYIMKSEPVEHLIKAIQMVKRGCIYLSPAMISRILGSPGASGEGRLPISNLTDRELEVFQLIGEGYSVDAIKDQLHVSRGAVDKYRRRAMKKLDCDSVRDLLRYAVLWVHEQGTRNSGR